MMMGEKPDSKSPIMKRNAHIWPLVCAAAWAKLGKHLSGDWLRV